MILSCSSVSFVALLTMVCNAERYTSPVSLALAAQDRRERNPHTPSVSAWTRQYYSIFSATSTILAKTASSWNPVAAFRRWISFF